MRDCLGYATDPGETAYTIAVQPFEGRAEPSLLLSATTPEGNYIYLTYRTYIGGSSCSFRPSICCPDYERVPYPAR